MDPHPLANLFKLAAYCKPIANNEVPIGRLINTADRFITMYLLVAT